MSTTRPLTLEQKIPISGPPRKGRFEPRFLSIAIVGQDAICIGQGSGGIVGLDRESLARAWFARAGAPVYWWDASRLVIWKDRGIGVWDVARNKQVWLVNGRSCHRWRDFVVTSEARGQLSLLDGTTGRVSARIDLGEPMLVGPPTLCGDVMLCDGWESEATCAVNLSERRVLWSRQLGPYLDQAFGLEPDAQVGAVLTAGASNDGVIATRRGRTFRIAVGDGRPLWRAEVLVPYGCPLVERGLIPVLSMDRFVVLDELTGEIRVDRRHGDLSVMFHARPGSLWSEEAVAFVSESGHVALLSLVNGDLLWSQKYDVPFLASVVADGRLLVSGGDGNLWVFGEGATTTSVIAPGVKKKESRKSRPRPRTGTAVASARVKSRRMPSRPKR
jgi:PQQ-like domain